MSTESARGSGIAAARRGRMRSLRAEQLLDVVIRSVGPVLLALGAGALLLLALGRDPVTFYRHLVRIQTAITSWSALVRRVASPAPVAIRFAHARSFDRE